MPKALLVLALCAGAASAAGAQAVTVTLTEWKIDMSRDTVRAGSTTFRITNKGTIAHGFYVLGPGVDKGSREMNANENASLTVTLKPGSYEIYCPMADLSHKKAGMSRTLVVVPAS